MGADRGLARCLGAPGGLTLEQACARGDAKVAELAERGAELISQRLAEIAGLTAQGAPSPQDRARIHAKSCEIAGLGGVFGRSALSKAAYSLCRLLDETGSGWSAEGVALHLHAMRILCSPAATSDAAQDDVIKGLVKVRRYLERARQDLQDRSR